MRVPRASQELFHLKSLKESVPKSYPLFVAKCAPLCKSDSGVNLRNLLMTRNAQLRCDLGVISYMMFMPSCACLARRALSAPVSIPPRHPDIKSSIKQVLHKQPLPAPET